MYECKKHLLQHTFLKTLVSNKQKNKNTPLSFLRHKKNHLFLSATYKKMSSQKPNSVCYHALLGFYFY